MFKTKYIYNIWFKGNKTVVIHLLEEVFIFDIINIITWKSLINLAGFFFSLPLCHQRIFSMLLKVEGTCICNKGLNIVSYLQPFLTFFNN